MTGVFRGRKNKGASMRLEHLAREENFQFVRSRLRIVRLFRYLLKARHDQFAGLPTFTALAKSITSLDRTLDHCELLLRRYAVGEMSMVELRELLHDDVYTTLDEDASDLRPSNHDDDQASMDANELMERIWEEIMTHVRTLQDALLSASDNASFAVPEWRLQFERDEGAVFDSTLMADNALD
jgi:hypothetical protein